VTYYFFITLQKLKIWGFEPEQSGENFKAKALPELMRRMDAARIAQAGCKEQTGCLRLEAKSPFYIKRKLLFDKQLS